MMPSNELAKADTRFDALLDAAVDGIVLIDHNGTIAAFNRAAERLFGYSGQETLGANVSMLMPAADRASHDEHMRRYLETRQAHIIGKGREVEARRKDGTTFPVFLSVGVISGTEPPQFVGFIQDLSLRRQAEEDNHRLQERLTHVSHLATMGELLSGLAHELNQPLTAVANYAQACDRLLALPDPDVAEVREALQQITAQAVRAGDMIRKLRALARNDQPEREITDVNTLLGELNELILLEAKTHGVSYKRLLAPELPAVEINRAQIQQVILNLVRNAVEAVTDSLVRPGAVTISTHRSADGDVEIAVRDNGPGVSASILTRLFDPFCTTKPHGTGLGLAVSRSIVKAHEGSLDYCPGSPHGAWFMIRLPMVVA
jgi:two-component system, LuxR family, sensor kinase FixL